MHDLVLEGLALVGAIFIVVFVIHHSVKLTKAVKAKVAAIKATPAATDLAARIAELEKVVQAHDAALHAVTTPPAAAPASALQPATPAATPPA